MSELRVAWQEFYEPHHAEDYEDWHPLPPTNYEGTVINAVRAFGETRLVVMLDDGNVREVRADRVRRTQASQSNKGRPRE